MADQRRAPTGGHVIDNPISGERIVIRQSGADTHGELLSFDLFLPPGGHVPATHAHPAQEERFTVMAGEMRFRVGRHTIVAGSGDTVVVPPRTAHWFGNAAAVTTVARVEIRPALRMEELLERSGALGASRSWPGIVVPRLPDLAAVLLEFDRELVVPKLPALLVRLCLLPLAWLARRRATARV